MLGGPAECQRLVGKMEAGGLGGRLRRAPDDGFGRPLAELRNSRPCSLPAWLLLARHEVAGGRRQYKPMCLRTWLLLRGGNLDAFLNSTGLFARTGYSVGCPAVLEAEEQRII